MKLKKLTAILLAVLMVSVLMVPLSVPAGAADATVVCKILPPEGQTFADGTVTEFASIDAATAAINTLAMDGITIKMVAATGQWATNAYVMNYNFTFDGEYETGKYATITGSTYWLDIRDGATIKNVIFNASHGFRYRNNHSNGAFSLENVTFNYTGNGLLVNIQGETANNAQTFNLTNCKITKPSNRTGDPIIATHGTNNHTVTVNLHNTEITYDGGADNNSNGALFLANTIPATVNLTGNTVLNHNGIGSNQTSMFNSKFVITLNIGSETDNGSGVVLNLGPAEGGTPSNGFSATGRSFFTNAANAVINDKGGTWKVHSTIAAGGFTMPAQTGYAAYETADGITVLPGKLIHTVGADGEDLVMKHTNDATITAGTTEAIMDAGVVAKIGDTEYTTLAAALAVGGTIDLVTNLATGAITPSKDFVLNGNGNMIVSGAGYVFDIRGNSTFNNVVMLGKVGTRLNPMTAGQTMTNIYNNCEITNNGANLTFNVQGVTAVADIAELHTVELNGCTFNHSSIDNFMLAHREKKLANITLKDSTVNFVSTKDAIFNLCIESGKLNLNLEGNTVINNKSSNAKAKIFFVHDWKQGEDGDPQTATLTFEDGVVINNTPTGATSATFIDSSAGANPMTLVDNGATWNVNANWAAKGFTFGAPMKDVIALEGTDGKLYNPNALIKTGDVVSFKTVAALEGDMITNGEGASIRTADPDGIRFKTTVNEEAYALLGDYAQFGAMVSTKEYLDLAEGDFAKLAENTFITTPKDLNWKEEGKTFITVLTNIDEANYETVYVVTGFVTITYADGTTATVYADYTEANNARSIYYVATEALADEEYTYTDAQLAYLNAIKDAVEADVAE